MKRHTKILLDFLNIGHQDRPLCEYCGERELVDVHHCIFKGMGGSKNLDYIENLAGLCRECHDACHDSSTFNTRVKEMAADLEERKRCHEMRERYRLEKM